MTHLALAWAARDPNTSSVILGASKPEQVLDNLKALNVIPKLSPDVIKKIEGIIDNKPIPVVGLCSILCTRPKLMLYPRAPLAGHR